jgi:type II secretory pathway pseudopilin PulG
MTRASRTTHHHCAFTIVEILVVVALVLILLSLVIVAVNSATRTAQATNTRALMNSMSQAMVQFREDVGYLPPVLYHNRDLRWPDGSMHGPDPTLGYTPAYFNAIQDWHSVTSLAEFLLGYGPESEDGHDGLGIRNPGPDGYWGASTVLQTGISGTPGTFEYRTAYLNSAASESYRQGRVYGAYLQLRDDRLLGAIDPNAGPDEDGKYRVFFPGESGYDPAWPKVIVDYWGEPIRYYRRPYPPGGISRGYRIVRNGPLDLVPSLSHVIALRPWSFRDGEDVDIRPATNGFTFADDEGDVSTSRALNAAEFAFYSSGPSRRFDQTVRVDRDGEDLNIDNIVELGQ